MATSNTGGAFGYLRKSIGAVVYSVSTASIKGIKKQVARLKPTSVRNPRTISQIVQRMKVVPAQLFYQAFEKAAGSVENNPLSHSFQGVAYGNKNKLRFMQLAMQGDPKAYVPKGIIFPVPGVYQVSEGSLPNLPSGNANSGAALLTVGTAITSTNFDFLVAMGLQAGDQITCMALLENGGVYRAAFARVILGLGNDWQFNNDENDLTDIQLLEGGIDVSATASGNVACVAFVASRGTSSATAKRSTAFMTITPDYADLMSPEAYDAAVESYISGISYNSLNSDWYLNQGTTQAFNGEVFLQELTVAPDGTTIGGTWQFLLGRQSNGGTIIYTIFTQDVSNVAVPTVYFENEFVPNANTTLEAVQAALGGVNYRTQVYSAAIGQQALGNA